VGVEENFFCILAKILPIIHSMQKIMVFLFVSLVFGGCKNPESEECASDLKPDSLEVVQEVNGDNLLNTNQSKSEKENQSNHLKIVEKYGQQWDFCNCVRANDSINHASQGNLTESEATKLMQRWEEVEVKCKEFLTNPNRTPEQRKRHAQKVAKCLQGN
jgi:hypothetical protein